MKLDDCSAVITGASAGIGREFAQQLALRAQRIVLVARRGDRLEERREELQAKNPALQVDIQVADLSVLEQVMELGRALSKDKPVDFLINNAGLGDYGPVSTADPRRLNEMIQVNVLAVTALTRVLLPQMIAQKRGAILNVSSSAGFLPIPDFAVYAATKAYVTNFSEALRAEVRGSGISVCALCPGPVHTEFMAVAAQGQPRSENAPEFVHVPVEKVVRAGLNGIERDKALVIPGTIMKIGMALARLSPIALMRLGWRFSERRV
jgi:short-subunit dehydrogenase